MIKAIGNRSLALFDSGDYIACLSDVQWALDVVNALSDEDQAAAAGYKYIFNETIIHSCSIIKKLRTRAENCRDRISATKKEGLSPKELAEEALSHGSHARAGKICHRQQKLSTPLAELSRAVTMARLPGKGRGLLAAQDVLFGDVLIVEDACVASNSASSESSTKDVLSPRSSLASTYLCHHCLHRLPRNWIPCCQCSHESVRFCSTACRDAVHFDYIHMFHTTTGVVLLPPMGMQLVGSNIR